MKKRAELKIHGKVQGVFFRENTKKKAIELGLKGYVKNLEDKTVEAVAQGEIEKIKELIQFCMQSPGSSYVSKIDIKKKEPREEFSGFEIRF